MIDDARTDIRPPHNIHPHRTDETELNPLRIYVAPLFFLAAFGSVVVCSSSQTHQMRVFLFENRATAAIRRNFERQKSSIDFRIVEPRVEKLLVNLFYFISSILKHASQWTAFGDYQKSSSSPSLGFPRKTSRSTRK